MKIIFCAFVFVFTAIATLRAQPSLRAPREYGGSVELKAVGTLPKVIREASGLEITSSGLIWTHNDDRLSILYGLDSSGNTVKTVHLNHPNHGWEDLARDRDGNLYIGAFGNNKNDKDSLTIYKLPDPDGIEDRVTTAEIIRYSYPDQTAFPPSPDQMNFDMDAFVSIGDSLYLFTKNRTEPFTGYSRVYRVSREAGRYSAQLFDSLYLGPGPMMDAWVTSADISPNGKWLALLSHDCLWLVTDFCGKRFSSGKIYKVNLKNYSHKTGVCFRSDSQVYILDELEFGLIGGKIYFLDLSGVFEAISGGK